MFERAFVTLALVFSCVVWGWALLLMISALEARMVV